MLLKTSLGSAYVHNIDLIDKSKEESAETTIKTNKITQDQQKNIENDIFCEFESLSHWRNTRCRLTFPSQPRA